MTAMTDNHVATTHFHHFPANSRLPLESIVIIVVVGVIAGDTAKCEYSQAVTDNPFDPSVWEPVAGFET